MPYFDDVRRVFDEVLYWVDARHEQRGDVQPVLRRLRRDLDKAKRALEKAKPDTALAKREPNKLREIQALRPDGPRKLCRAFPKDGLEGRMRGAWLGRAAGCTLGVPVEAWEPDAMEDLARLGKQPFPPKDYWAVHPRASQRHYNACTFRDYLKGGIRAMPVDDDLAYTQLGLLILEKYGPHFTTRDVAAAWLDLVPIACTAEDVALRNLRRGVTAMKAGEAGNPFHEWIGADIRSDPWGYAAPGWPERAAAMAYRDAYLTHRRNGLYGAMFFAAAIAAAFVVDSPIEAIRVGLTEIPRHCRLAGDVRWALGRAPHLRDWRDARRAVDRRFKGMHVVHTNNNACLTVFGLYLGKGDFTRTIGYTVAMGLDNDCTAATAGSIFGAVYGIERIPPHWWKPFGNRVHSYLRGQDGFTTTGLVRRFIAAGRAVWEERVGE
jgi:ADP-ribosylglycohydrolase